MPDQFQESTQNIQLATDGRQSETAARIQRGVCGILHSRNFAMLTEFTLATGRRADVVAISQGGDIWIIEIKSSIGDFRSDRKWPDYQDYCDAFYFAIPPHVPPSIIPDHTGLIIADAHGAEILRDAPIERLAAARRKAVTLRFARSAARRHMGLEDLSSDFS